jgi:hypothetical protein
VLPKQELVWISLAAVPVCAVLIYAHGHTSRPAPVNGGVKPALAIEPERVVMVPRGPFQPNKRAKLHHRRTAIPTRALGPETRTAFFYGEDDSLTAADVAPFFKGKFVPKEILHFDENGRLNILAARVGADKIARGSLILSDEGAARNVAQQRLAEEAIASDTFFRNHRQNSQGDEESFAGLRALAADDSTAISFLPGLRDDHMTVILNPPDIAHRVLGPDYDLSNIDPDDDEGLERIKDRVLSFGHGGQMILGVKDNGFIADRPGADFVIYENVFRYGSGKLYQEFAYVGVSETLNPQDFKWFPFCDPRHGAIKDCAGVVPTKDGGDRFDLANIGVRRARYIWIKDWGHNANQAGGINTEGFDLDAIELIHGYTKK